MTNKELKEKIAHLETELAEVKEMAVAMKKKVDGGGVFKPENGQGYWFISGSGDAREDRWDDYSIDNSHYSIGNCYPTKQAAEDFVRALKLIQRARESQDGFAPDWKDPIQHKYFLDCHMGDIGVADHPSINVAPVFGHWEDKSVCEQFIDEEEEEIIWFFTEYRRWKK